MEATPSDNPFIVPAISETPLSLKSNWPAILNSTQQEQQFWGWILNVRDQGFGGQIQNVANENLQGPLSRMLNAATHLSQQDLSDLNNLSAGQHNQYTAFINEYQSALQAYLDRNLSSHTPGAQIVASIRDSDVHGPIVAAGAFMALIGQNIDVSKPALIKGIVVFVSRLEGWSQQGAVTAAATLKNSTEDLTRETRDALSLFKSQANEIETSSETFAEEIRTRIDTHISAFSKSSHDLAEQSQAAIKSIDDTRAAYTEQMRLKASVEYWREAAKIHQGRQTEAWNNLKWFLWRGGIAGVVAYIFFLLVAVISPADNHLLSIVLGAGAVATATALIWAGRVLVRIYLSEKHMWTDAEERSTIIQTYLALVKEGKIEDTERQLVLGPIFRHGSDGIVRDDGIPLISLPGLLSGGK